jgi:peptidoglycan/LPS O-acetylase OafA/YrhL
VIVGWQTGFSPLMYLPVFGVGVLIAVHFDKLSRVRDRFLTGSYSRTAMAGAVTFAVVCLTSEWWVLGIGASRTAANVAAAIGVPGGATLLIMMAMRSGSVARVLEIPPIHWLGTRSFSLYLIHEPIVVSVATMLPDRDNPTIVTLIGITVSLLCAEIFCRLVEHPSHRLARWVGASVTGFLTDIQARRTP